KNLSEATAISWPNAASRRLPGTHQMRTGVGPTRVGSVCSSSPTTMATRYVDMTIESAKRTILRGPSRVSLATRVFDATVRVGSTASVTLNTALKAGSSQQGNARRASVASNCVAAIVRDTPLGSL